MDKYLRTVNKNIAVGIHFNTNESHSIISIMKCLDL